MSAAWDWFCNAVNGNLPNVPSPVAWGAVAVVIIGPAVKRMHAKLDHIIEHHPAIPPFLKK